MELVTSSDVPAGSGPGQRHRPVVRHVPAVHGERRLDRVQEPGQVGDLAGGQPGDLAGRQALHLGGVQAGVSQDLLDIPDIGPVLQH